VQEDRIHEGELQEQERKGEKQIGDLYPIEIEL
jgi:hypothetical protein